MPPDSLAPYRRILWLVAVFLLIGHMMLFSATGIMGSQRFGSEFYYVSRQAVGAMAGVALMVLLSQIRYQVWGKIAYFLIAAQIAIVALTYVPGLGHSAQGAQRWLRVGPMLFQPSELGKITVSIYMATLLSLHAKQPLARGKWLLYALPLLLLLGLVLGQPDLGTTILLTGLVVGALFIAGLRPAYLISFLLAGGGFFFVAMLSSDYRRRRLEAFINPWLDPQGSGFQAIQSLLSLHSGKLLGQGIGNGNSKLFFLPEVHTDFIFALIGEELGFVGAAGLLCLFVYFCHLLFKVSLRAKDDFGLYLGFGLALCLAVQVAVNVGGVTGLLPMKGLTLPSISWGRSSLIVNFALVGILLNIAAQQGDPSPSAKGA